MTPTSDPRPALGPPIALTLRVGTLLAVAGIGVGYLLEAITGEDATGTVVDLLVGGGGAGALIGAGFLALTLTPLAALAVAATVLTRRGERGRALAATLAFALLLVSLITAAVVGAAI
jgi:hypothetical protein